MSNSEVDITYRLPFDPADLDPSWELEYRNSRHVVRIWETVSGWIWSCKHCEARDVRLDSMAEAMTGAALHMRTEVPWWRKALDRIAP